MTIYFEIDETVEVTPDTTYTHTHIFKDAYCKEVKQDVAVCKEQVEPELSNFASPITSIQTNSKPIEYNPLNYFLFLDLLIVLIASIYLANKFHKKRKKIKFLNSITLEEKERFANTFPDSDLTYIKEYHVYENLKDYKEQKNNILIAIKNNELLSFEYKGQFLQFEEAFILIIKSERLKLQTKKDFFKLQSEVATYKKVKKELNL